MCSLVRVGGGLGMGWGCGRVRGVGVWRLCVGLGLWVGVVFKRTSGVRPYGFVWRCEKCLNRDGIFSFFFFLF